MIIDYLRQGSRMGFLWPSLFCWPYAIKRTMVLAWIDFAQITFWGGSHDGISGISRYLRKINFRPPMHWAHPRKTFKLYFNQLAHEMENPIQYQMVRNLITFRYRQKESAHAIIRRAHCVDGRQSILRRDRLFSSIPVPSDEAWFMRIESWKPPRILTKNTEFFWLRLHFYHWISNIS